jgi:hypothetical protein
VITNDQFRAVQWINTSVNDPRQAAYAWQYLHFLEGGATEPDGRGTKNAAYIRSKLRLKLMGL